MATIKENIEKPEYKLLSGLVLGTEEKLNEWAKEERETLNADVGRFVTRASFIRYEEELDKLVQQIKEAKTFYETDVAGLDKACSWTTFPNQHKAYREKIYELERQQNKVSAEKRFLQAKKAEEERAARRSRSEPAPAPKKSGWWKHAVAYTVLGAGLITAWFGKGDKSPTQSGPSEGDKAPVRTEERTTENTNVKQEGNTFVAKSPLEAAREEAELTRLLKISAYNKEEIAKSEHRTRMRDLDRLQKEAYTLWYQHEKAEEAIRSGLRTEQDRIYTVWYKNDRGQSTIRNISATQLRLVENQRLMAKGQLGVIKDRAELNAYLNATRNSMARDNSGTYRTVMNDTYRW